MGITYEGEILLSTSEAAEHLEVGTSTIERLCSSRALVERRLEDDRRRYITLKSILAFDRDNNPSMRRLASRLAMLEDRVNFLCQKLLTKGDVEQVEDTIRQNHPHLFQKGSTRP